MKNVFTELFTLNRKILRFLKLIIILKNGTCIEHIKPKRFEMKNLFFGVLAVLSLSLSAQSEALDCYGGGFGLFPVETVALECEGFTSKKMYDALLGGAMIGAGVKYERLILNCPGTEGDALLGSYSGGRGQIALIGGVSAGYFRSTENNRRCYAIGLMGGASIGISGSGIEIKPWGQGFKRNK